MKSIYISYNPDNAMEQNTALRMQTISSLYGISVELPARINTNSLSTETKNRIIRGSFILAISLYQMSEALKKELSFAMQQKKPIIVIYDAQIGKTIEFNGYSNVQEIHIDFNNTEPSLHQIAQFLQKQPALQPPKQEEKDNSMGVALGVVAIGLGLLALWGLAKDE